MAEIDESRVRTKKEQEMLDELIREGEGKEETYLSLEKHRNGLLRDFLRDYVQYVSLFRSGELNNERLELFITDGIKQSLKNDQPRFAMEFVNLGKELSVLSEDAIYKIAKYLAWKSEKQICYIINSLLGLSK